MMRPPPSLRTQISWLHSAFTLLELLVTVAILTLLLTLFGQMFSGTSATIHQGYQHMATDAAAQNLLDRMAIDLNALVYHSDLDYYLKSPSHPQPGNDQLAFFAHTPGFYPSKGSRSPHSLVAYRVSASHHQTERMGKGLLWNGESAIPSLRYLPHTIASTWPTATNQSPDSDFELVAPQVFRIEYAYLLRGATLPGGTTLPARFSSTPWDDRIPEHTNINGLQDVAALVVTIAILNPQNTTLLSAHEIQALSEAMVDFTPPMTPDTLAAQWQAAVSDSTHGIPLELTSKIRIYTRHFPLSSY